MCGLLHLMYLDSWTLHECIACPHFQHFLHYRIPRFIFALQTIVIKLSTIKHLLIKPFTLVPLYVSQMSSHMIAMSDLEDFFFLLTIYYTVRIGRPW